jgi:excisionase family DNA binding protein
VEQRPSVHERVERPGRLASSGDGASSGRESLAPTSPACSDPRSYSASPSRQPRWADLGSRRSAAILDDARPGDDATYLLLLTIPQVCNALAVSRDAVYELLRSGRLPSVNLGRSRRIRLADLDRRRRRDRRTPPALHNNAAAPSGPGAVIGVPGHLRDHVTVKFVASAFAVGRRPEFALTPSGSARRRRRAQRSVTRASIERSRTPI